MSNYKELCERLDVLGQAVADRNFGEFSMRVPAEPNRDADLVISRAAQVIREQAARIAELEAQVARDDEHYAAAMAMSEKHRRNWVEAAQRVAELEKPKAKRLVWDESRFERVAKTGIGEFRIFLGRDAFSAYRVPYADYMLLLGELATESEARAACQAEFDRIHAEMTEQWP